MPDGPDAIGLDIYGYRVELRASSPGLLSGLAEEFAYFRIDHVAGGPVVELSLEDPPYEDIPEAAQAAATVYTPRNVSYRSGNTTFVDYSGRALGVHDTVAGDFRVYSRDCHLLHEAAYLFLLSHAGEYLDRHRLHRVHALGVSMRGRAALALLPMGGGKSTLGAQLLRFPDVELLSDDSPLVDAHGDIHAFPLHLGLLPGSEGDIPGKEIRVVQRMEFGPKLVVSYSQFADRVVDKAVPGILFLGRRSLGRDCIIKRAGSGAALRALFVNSVVGLGLFQGMEFVFQRGAGEVFTKAWTALSRLRASMRLLARSQAYTLVLGRDARRNAETVVEFLRDFTGKDPGRET